MRTIIGWFHSAMKRKTPAGSPSLTDSPFDGAQDEASRLTAFAPLDEGCSCGRLPAPLTLRWRPQDALEAARHRWWGLGKRERHRLAPWPDPSRPCLAAGHLWMRGERAAASLTLLTLRWPRRGPRSGSAPVVGPGRMQTAPPGLTASSFEAPHLWMRGLLCGHPRFPHCVARRFPIPSGS